MENGTTVVDKTSIDYVNNHLKQGENRIGPVKFYTGKVNLQKKNPILNDPSNFIQFLGMVGMLLKNIFKLAYKLAKYWWVWLVFAGINLFDGFNNFRYGFSSTVGKSFLWALLFVAISFLVKKLDLPSKKGTQRYHDVDSKLYGLLVKSLSEQGYAKTDTKTLAYMLESLEVSYLRSGLARMTTQTNEPDKKGRTFAFYELPGVWLYIDRENDNMIKTGKLVINGDSTMVDRYASNNSLIESVFQENGFDYLKILNCVVENGLVTYNFKNTDYTDKLDLS